VGSDATNSPENVDRGIRQRSVNVRTEKPIVEIQTELI
jgi:hypothetical protein